MNVKRNRLKPQIILLDGATGSGKSTLLKYMREKYFIDIQVGTKLTTRKKRAGDNEWEFNFVETISDQFSDYIFSSVNNQYAIVNEELLSSINKQKIYAISCVDKSIAETLRSQYRVLMIYIYRPLTKEDLDQLFLLRQTSNLPDSTDRIKEWEFISLDYTEKIYMYDHVLLNIGTQDDLLKQIDKLINYYVIEIENPKTVQ